MPVAGGRRLQTLHEDFRDLTHGKRIAGSELLENRCGRCATSLSRRATTVAARVLPEMASASPTPGRRRLVQQVVTAARAGNIDPRDPLMIT